MNLDKSVQLLDEAVTGKSARNRDLSRLNSPFPKGNNFAKGNLNLSVTLAHHEMVRLASNETFGETFNSTVFNTMIDDTVGETSTFLEGPDARQNPVDALYELFFEIVQSNETDAKVFNMISELVQICSDVLDTLPDCDGELGILSRDRHWLTRERNTWRLLYCLYQDRMLEKYEDMDINLELTTALSEKSIIQKLYSSCSLLRECQLVVDWLEQSAAEIPRPQNPQQYTDRTVACENTLHHLQCDGNTAFGSVRPMVTHLDPDAPCREKLSLHDLDTEDQYRLAKSVFLDVRSGQLDVAQKTCCHCGEYWRAAILEGWRLYHDPNYEHFDAKTGEVKKLPEGNPNRALWKLCAWKMAEDAKTLDVYTRATLGALCGHLGSLVGPCSDSWEDLLWAYLKVQIDIRVETEIKHNYIKDNSYTMVDEYWKNKMSMEQVFAEISACRNDKVSMDSRSPDRKIQQYLIMDDLANLMKGMDSWIVSDENPSAQFIRFLAHLVLFFRRTGKSFSEDICNSVLESYVGVLIKKGNPNLVAYYTAQLPQKRQIILYSKFLEHHISSTTRKQCLEAAETIGLNVDEITKYTVKMICEKDLPGEMPLQGTISEGAQIKISSLDYLMYNPKQRSEALWQTNSLVRKFLIEGNIEAAREAFKKITPDSLDMIHVVNAGPNLNLPPREQCSIREYLCMKGYLDSQDEFNDWFQHFHHGKPHAPNSVQPEATFTERVAMDHKTKQYQAELDRWSIALHHQTECIKKLFYNVLDFPGNGWLVDPVDPPENLSIEDAEEWDRRKQQMSNLRKLCIYKVVLLLHTVMHSVGEYQECVQLADIVMSDKNKYYKLYSKHKLSELLTKIAESSLALLDQKKDAWGYPVSV